MSKIHVLPKQVAELIAAGEVVERPASVVKELLENSVDAGASSVTVEIKNGGISYIRITDDGCGIAGDDVETAFISHATSKISTGDDLYSIKTLGFRGEALASIAAVSRVALMTRTRDEQTGTLFEIEGGERVTLEEAGCPSGTTITVRDIFFNTPARMKFLKKDVTEGNAVASVVERIALSHPEISIKFIRDGKKIFSTPGDNSLFSAIYTVLGKQFANVLIEAGYDYNGITVRGYVCKPQNSRPNRNMQFFFINGRLVKSGTCSAAVSEGYRNLVMTGKFPACVLNISIPEELVDVNVHPAKTEVRFENERDVFNAVYFACKSAVDTHDTTDAYSFKSGDGEAAGSENVQPEPPHQAKLSSSVNVKYNSPAHAANTTWQRMDAKDFRLAFGSDESRLDIKFDEKYAGYPTEKQSKINGPADSAVKSEAAVTRVNTGDTGIGRPVYDKGDVPVEAGRERADIDAARAGTQRILEVHEVPRAVGEAFDTYIIAQMGDELYFIDKHAAHERMIFNELKQREDGREGQLLIQPERVSLARDEYAAVLENMDLVNSAGFYIEDFGDGSVIVREVPSVLQNENICDIIIEIAGRLADNKNDITPKRLDGILHTVACRSAVKAGDFTSKEEMQAFTEKLFEMPEIKYCPHGRPVMFTMRKLDLEKQFKRKL